MITKNELKYYSSLLNKKDRNNEKKFLVEGKRLIEEGLKSSYDCELLLVTDHFIKAHPKFIENFNHKHLRVETLSENDFKKLSDTKSPQGIAAVFDKPQKDSATKITGMIVALENISDPGNLGTIIRNCDWFGIKNILLSEESAEIYNPKVVRSSMGSLFHLNIVQSEFFFDDLLRLKSRGFKLYCADMSGSSIYEMKYTTSSVFIFCNEAGGPSEGLLKIINAKITIPKYGNAESLNVANASAVILSEVMRKK